METKAIRIAAKNRDHLLDIPYLDPRDADAAIQHYSTMDVYYIVTTHDNRVSAEVSVANFDHLYSNYDYDAELIQSQFVPITLK